MPPLPVLPCQRPIARAEMREDADGQIVTETLVFPNLCVFFLVDPETGVRVGDHRVCSPKFARQFVPELERLAEHVNGCSCQMHDGRHMEMLDPESDYS